MPDATCEPLRAELFIHSHGVSLLLDAPPLPQTPLLPLARPLLPSSLPRPRPERAAEQVWLGGRVFPLFISEKMDSGKRLLKPLPTLSQLMGVIHLCPFLPDKTLLED